MTVPNQRLAEINSQIAAARATQSAASAKAQVLREMLRSGRLDAVPDVARDNSLRKYAEARVALKAEIAEESRTLLPGHPRMKELSGQLAGLDEEMRDAAAKAVRGYEDEARLTGDQVKSLERAVEDESKALASTDSDQVQLQSLELEVQVSTRTARILHGQVPRGDRTRLQRRGAAERSRHRDSDSTANSCVSEKGPDPDSRHARWVHSFAVGGRRKGHTRGRRRRSCPSPQPNRLGERRVRASTPTLVALGAGAGSHRSLREPALARHRGGRRRRDR